MCSGLNNQLSTLSEELSDQAQLKANLETQIEQLSDEIAQQNESATAKIQTLQDENNDMISKCNDTQQHLYNSSLAAEAALAKVQSLEDENNNLVSKCNDTQSKLNLFNDMTVGWTNIIKESAQLFKNTYKIIFVMYHTISLQFS